MLWVGDRRLQMQERCRRGSPRTSLQEEGACKPTLALLPDHLPGTRTGCKQPVDAVPLASLHTQRQPPLLPCACHPTCVYLSMNMSALGTLLSPRCTTEEPTQEPMRR